MWGQVCLTPEAEQADLDKAQARIAVVALTEGGDEVQNRGLEIGVLIVWEQPPPCSA